MKLLEKLFGWKATENETSVIDEPITDNELPFDLFINDIDPSNDQDLQAQSKSRISTFLDCNYHSIGLKEGYETRSTEILNRGKKKIRSKFHLIMDQMIQEKSERRLELKMMVVKVEGIESETKRNLELTIDELDSSMSLLQTQKELSVENEGWVMNAIHEYHQGFSQGVNEFIEQENLLNSINNI
jgi:hypothetical protein